MKKEITVNAATVEEAIENALKQIEMEKEDCEIEVLETPRKTLFGRVEGEAVVKVSYTMPELSVAQKKLNIAKKYLRDIIDKIGLPNVAINITESEDSAIVNFEGEGVAALIGHHGETLDSLQYLVALACNKVEGDYYRITLDCGNYREKREATLEGLARRIGNRVKKTGKSHLLEPMNPYERRIIHAVISDIEGIYSRSKGLEPNRRILILSEKPVRNSRPERKPYVHKKERTMEEILKSDYKETKPQKTNFDETELKADLYSKIDL